MRLIIAYISLLLLRGAKGASFQNYASSNPRESFLHEILAESMYPNSPTTPTPKDMPLKVGIIGAGAAGLYAAMLLDSLGIEYDLIEASDRVGGRIYTYRFNETAWSDSTPDDPDYYDYFVSINPIFETTLLIFSGCWGDEISRHGLHGSNHGIFE